MSSKLLSMDRIKEEDRRLAILVALHEEVSGTLNEHLLQAWLQTIGHAVTTEQVLEDCVQLEKLGVVRTERDREDALVVKLTDRGDDFLQRRVAIEGIRSPRYDSVY